jgi:2Fe-2S ferredoxin
MENIINITVINEGVTAQIEVPNDMGLNLMELLKANEYEKIEGTCGGMALCATCHVKVLESSPALPEQSDDEFAMLETLPTIFDNSRLGCQIKLNDGLQKITIEIP